MRPAGTKRLLRRRRARPRATAEKDRRIVEMLVGLRRAISAAMLALRITTTADGALDEAGLGSVWLKATMP